jgi:hypothetical protein
MQNGFALPADDRQYNWGRFVFKMLALFQGSALMIHRQLTAPGRDFFARWCTSSVRKMTIFFIINYEQDSNKVVVQFTFLIFRLKLSGTALNSIIYL